MKKQPAKRAKTRKPVKTKSMKAKSAKTKPAKTKPAKAKPAKAKPAKTKPAKTKPAKAGSAKAKPVDSALFNRIQEVVSAFTKAEPERIQLRSRFADDLGINDELRVVEFAMYLEQELGIIVDDEVADTILTQRSGGISTFGDLVTFVARS